MGIPMSLEAGALWFMAITGGFALIVLALTLYSVKRSKHSDKLQN
jgi:hypothetical protein